LEETKLTPRDWSKLLFQYIKHGDTAHQEWLRNMLDDWFINVFGPKLKEQDRWIARTRAETQITNPTTPPSGSRQ
jgi:hypothetical protein